MDHRQLFNSNKKVLLYVPNLMAYVRCLFLLAGIITLKTSGLLTACFFTVVEILDAIDGLVARKLNQVSKTGALFDFTLDRVATASYLVGLIIFCKTWWWFFLFVLFLDIGSHFAHVYQSGFVKSPNHKNIESSNLLLNAYYNSKPLMLFCCFSFDVTLVLIYLTFWYDSFSIYLSLFFVVPGFLLKNYIHILQFISAVNRTLKMDLNEVKNYQEDGENNLTMSLADSI
jgi:CDP-diacylglycerol--inositol 3-phosphatidyltransferase